MTDYSSYFDDDDDDVVTESAADKAARLKKEAKAKRDAERKKTDRAFEKIVLATAKPKKAKRKVCSANSDLVKFAKHLKLVKTALKNAADDGFCLDEIMDGLKELGDE